MTVLGYKEFELILLGSRFQPAFNQARLRFEPDLLAGIRKAGNQPKVPLDLLLRHERAFALAAHQKPFAYDILQRPSDPFVVALSQVLPNAGTEERLDRVADFLVERLALVGGV